MKETCKTSLFVDPGVSARSHSGRAHRVFCWVVIVAPWSIFGFVIFYFTLLARYVRSGTAKPKHATQVVLSVGLCRLYSRLCGQIIVLSRVFLSLFRQWMVLEEVWIKSGSVTVEHVNNVTALVHDLPLLWTPIPQRSRISKPHLHGPRHNTVDHCLSGSSLSSGWSFTIAVVL